MRCWKPPPKESSYLLRNRMLRFNSQLSASISISLTAIPCHFSAFPIPLLSIPTHLVTIPARLSSLHDNSGTPLVNSPAVHQVTVLIQRHAIALSCLSQPIISFALRLQSFLLRCASHRHSCIPLLYSSLPFLFLAFPLLCPVSALLGVSLAQHCIISLCISQTKHICSFLFRQFS